MRFMYRGDYRNKWHALTLASTMFVNITVSILALLDSTKIPMRMLIDQDLA